MRGNQQVSKPGESFINGGLSFEDIDCSARNGFIFKRTNQCFCINEFTSADIDQVALGPQRFKNFFVGDMLCGRASRH